MAPRKSKAYMEPWLKENIQLSKFVKINIHTAASEKFKISKTCVRNICKQKSEYLHWHEEDEIFRGALKFRKLIIIK